MADKKVVALKKAWDAAEAEKRALVVERSEKRNSMPKAEFRSYNDATRQQQIEVEQKVRAAQKAFSEALGVIRDNAIQVAVGTISESESLN